MRFDLQRCRLVAWLIALRSICYNRANYIEAYYWKSISNNYEYTCMRFDLQRCRLVAWLIALRSICYNRANYIEAYCWKSISNNYEYTCMIFDLQRCWLVDSTVIYIFDTVRLITSGPIAESRFRIITNIPAWYSTCNGVGWLLGW